VLSEPGEAHPGGVAIGDFQLGRNQIPVDLEDIISREKRDIFGSNSYRFKIQLL
jgi:hypothetical protein